MLISKLHFDFDLALNIDHKVSLNCLSRNFILNGDRTSHSNVGSIATSRKC